MSSKLTPTQPLNLLRSSVNSLVSHPIILWPFVTIAFVQLIFVEILYFAPRFPLNNFFGPIIQRFFGEAYLHYPFNLVILSQLFQYGQIPLYIFVSSFFIAMGILIIFHINNNRRIHLRQVAQDTWAQYVHIVVAAIVMALALYWTYTLYGILAQKVLRSVVSMGIIPFLKVIIVKGSTFFYLLIGTFMTTLFAFVFPIIMIEKVKIFPAILKNFQNFISGGWTLWIVIFVSTLLYLPVLILRQNVLKLIDKSFPEISLLIVIFGILITIFMDAIIYTAITTYYLWQREHR